MAGPADRNRARAISPHAHWHLSCITMHYFQSYSRQYQSSLLLPERKAVLMPLTMAYVIQS